LLTISVVIVRYIYPTQIASDADYESNKLFYFSSPLLHRLDVICLQRRAQNNNSEEVCAIALLISAKFSSLHRFMHDFRQKKESTI
jgi:hypothetical protein